MGAVVPDPNLQSVLNADNQESTWKKSGGSKFKLEKKWLSEWNLQDAQDAAMR